MKIIDGIIVVTMALPVVSNAEAQAGPAAVSTVSYKDVTTEMQGAGLLESSGVEPPEVSWEVVRSEPMGNRDTLISLQENVSSVEPKPKTNTVVTLDIVASSKRVAALPGDSMKVRSLERDYRQSVDPLQVDVSAQEFTKPQPDLNVETNKSFSSTGPLVRKNPAALEKKLASQVVVNSVVFEGNTVFGSDALNQIAQPYISRPIDISDLEELRTELTRLYSDKGYVNSGAVLPDQQVENGKVLYRIVEGTLEGVKIEGAGRLRSKYISERVMKGASSPFNSIQLQKNFRLLLDDPLIDRMDGQLSALPSRGESQLNLQVTRATPYNFTIEGNNHSSPSLGAGQLLVAGLVRNITGLGDDLSLQAARSESRTSLTAGYSVPLNSNDTRLSLQLSFSESGVIEEPLDAIDIESDTEGFDISVSHTLSRGAQKQVTIGSGLAIRENSNLLAGQPFSFSLGEDEGISRVSVLRFWHEYIHRQSVDVFAARSTLNVGLDAFDSTQHDDGRPDSQFVSLQTQLQYARRYLEDRGQLLLRVEGQWANHSLLPLQRFSIGGASSVRGYRENEVVRDQAVMASAEFRYSFLRTDQLGVFTFAPFVDYGFGRNRSNFDASESLSSIGAGLLWDFNKSIAAHLYYGYALLDPPNSSGDSLQDKGLHFRFQAQY